MGMLIDGIFGSEAIDSSGEILNVEGADISSLEKDGVLNFEHRGDDAPGASPNDIVGKVVKARKIFTADDCENDREKMYWEQIELPFIYGVVRLYDGSGHPGAVALAAQIRDHVANGEPPIIRFSVEGSTLEKKNNILVRSVIRRIAATIKPCNKSAAAGILHDPHAPEGFKEKPDNVERSYIDDILDNAKKSEHGDPLHQKLGSSVEMLYVPYDELDKALDAGGSIGAPSTLTQGSALAPEHFSLRRKKVKDLAKRAMAAARDWNGLDDLDKFLKMRLPEASDEFVDKFKEMVHDYKIRKAEPQQSKNKVKAKQNSSSLEQPAPIKQAAEHGPLTILGKPIIEQPNVPEPHFDEEQGVLHTPRGSFKMYIPSQDPNPAAKKEFDKILNDPKVTAFHNYAIANWAKLNTLFKAGKLPPEAIMHAVLHSVPSRNTHVPDQELQFAHTVDHMKATGINAISPDFGKTKAGWLARDNPTILPVTGRSHFERYGDQTRNKEDSKLTGRKAGEIHPFSFRDSNFEIMSKYHQTHAALEKLLADHPGDAQGAVRELMHHRNKSDLWEAKRKREIARGKEDPGPYTEGPAVFGLQPKLARYTLGMLGGGDAIVPDTHFVRHAFGLDKRKDTPSIEYLKKILWNQNNSHILEGIDRYYNQHHDAVKHMLEHPHFAHLFQDDPMQANFPAFWKHWVGIAPHEAAIGRGSEEEHGAANQKTDHRPYWEANNEYVDQALANMGKSEEGDRIESLARRTVGQHQAWEDQFGEIPALMLYYAHIVPQLLASYHDSAQPHPDLEYDANVEPDTYAQESFEPDLEPTEGVARPFGNQPHVLPAHAFLPTMLKDALNPDSKSAHPAVNGGHYAILTGENPRFPVKTKGENRTLEKELTARKMKFEKVRGKYGGLENSFLIHNPNLKHVMDIGRRYGQESILHAEGPHAHLIYTNGPMTGKMHIADVQHTYQSEPEDYYTTVPGGNKDGSDLHFTWSPDWSKFHDVRPLLAEHAMDKKFDKNEKYEKRIRQLEYLNIELDSLLKAGFGESNPNPPASQEPLPENHYKPLPSVVSAGKYELGPTANNDEDFVHFQGKQVRPGRAFVYPTGMENTFRVRPVPFKILGHTAQGGILGVEAAKFGHHEPKDIKHIAAGKFELITPAEGNTEEPQVVNSALHGDWRYNRTDEQHKLIHGTDMKAPKAAPAEDGANAPYSHWRRMGENGSGPMAYVKRSGGGTDDLDFDEPHREVAYNNLARDVFGLGHYVPNAALFRHPKTNQPHAVIEKVKDGELPDFPRKERMGVVTNGYKMNNPHAKAIKQLGDSGELDKLAMMNAILGNHDRHGHNYLMTPNDKKAKLKLIDHGYNFAEDHNLPHFTDHGRNMRPFTPHYIHAYNAFKDEESGEGEGGSAEHEPVHPAAQEWLHGIQADKLAAHMADMGIPKKYIAEAAYRLQNLQQHLGRYPYFSRKRALESHFGPPASQVDDAWYKNTWSKYDGLNSDSDSEKKMDKWARGLLGGEPDTPRSDPMHEGPQQPTPEEKKAVPPKKRKPAVAKKAELLDKGAKPHGKPPRRAGESVEAYNRRIQRAARNKTVSPERVSRQFRSSVTGEKI